MELPECEIRTPDGQGRQDHDYVYLRDEYGSLAEGGSYKVYRCNHCGRQYWVPLPD